MDWVGWAFFVCLLGVILLGGYRVAQSPTFWAGMTVHVFRSAWPTIKKYLLLLIAYLLTPETPEDRKRRIEAERRGEDWNPITKRPKER